MRMSPSHFQSLNPNITMFSQSKVLLPLVALTLASAAAMARPLKRANEFSCLKTVYGGYLYVDAESSSHGSTPYAYPLAANASGIIVTSTTGEHFEFLDCRGGVEPDYETTYNTPHYGLLRVDQGPNSGKCLSITKLPADTVQTAGKQEFVPFALSECPKDTENGKDLDLVHKTWFSIDPQQITGAYNAYYRGNRTDNHPSLLGNSQQGSAVEGYYGSIGPSFGNFLLDPNPTHKTAFPSSNPLQ